MNVYDYDLANVDETDVFVAICDHPSIGLGMELERAFSTNTETYAFCKRGAKVTKIVPDGLIFNNQQPVIEYDTLEDIVEYMKKHS